MQRLVGVNFRPLSSSLQAVTCRWKKPSFQFTVISFQYKAGCHGSASRAELRTTWPIYCCVISFSQESVSWGRVILALFWDEGVLAGLHGSQSRGTRIFCDSIKVFKLLLTTVN